MFVKLNQQILQLVYFRGELQTGLPKNSIQINGKAKKHSSDNLNELLDEMKTRVSSWDTQSSSSSGHSDIENIFVNPSANSSYLKSKKELSIESWLNKLGIFQINIKSIKKYWILFY